MLPGPYTQKPPAERGPRLVTGVVLAAGQSRRMGRDKLLLPLAGTPMVRRVVERLRKAQVTDVLVIGGGDADALRATLHGIDCLVIENHRAAEGMATSFRAAAEALQGMATDAALFALADQPFVTTAMFDAVIDAYLPAAALAVVSRFGDVIGPPHLFTRALFPRIGKGPGDTARSLVTETPNEVLIVDLPPEALTDIDDEATYQRAAAVAEAERGR